MSAAPTRPSLDESPPAARASAGIPAAHEEILADLERWLAGSKRLFPTLAREEKQVRERIAQVRALGERIEAPLVILVVGGTGAGKSTLLNALAGADVAQASAVRPTTTALTVYHHVIDELQVPSELGDVKRAPHERPELQGKIVVDTPDFDSTLRANEAVLRRALLAADLVIVLTTPEKYADRHLHALLAEHRLGRAFVFALNRADRGVDEAVRADLERLLLESGFPSPRPLVLSALAAYRRKKGDRVPEGSEGEFRLLERTIERELTLARAREIKRLNLDALVLRLVDRAAAPLPPDLEERARSWRARGEAIAEDLARSLGARLSLRVREDLALRHEIAARIAMRPGGIFGLWQSLVWGLRGLRGEGVSGAARRLAVLDPAFARASGGPSADATDEDLAPDAEDDAQAAGAAIVLAGRRIADAGADAGTQAAEAPLAQEEAVRLFGAARRQADRAIAGALRALRLPGIAPEDAIGGGRRSLDASEGPSLLERARDGLLNAPPLAILAYALWRWFEAFARGQVLDTSWFVAAAIVTVVVLRLEGMLVDALARRRARRVVARLEEAAAASVRERVAQPILSRLERAIADVGQAGEDLGALRDRAREASGANAGATPLRIAAASDEGDDRDERGDGGDRVVEPAPTPDDPPPATPRAATLPEPPVPPLVAPTTTRGKPGGGKGKRVVTEG